MLPGAYRRQEDQHGRVRGRMPSLRGQLADLRQLRCQSVDSLSAALPAVVVAMSAGGHVQLWWPQ